MRHKKFFLQRLQAISKSNFRLINVNAQRATCPTFSLDKIHLDRREGSQLGMCCMGCNQVTVNMGVNISLEIRTPKQHLLFGTYQRTASSSPLPQLSTIVKPPEDPEYKLAPQNRLIHSAEAYYSSEGLFTPHHIRK